MTNQNWRRSKSASIYLRSVCLLQPTYLNLNTTFFYVSFQNYKDISSYVLYFSLMKLKLLIFPSENNFFWSYQESKTNTRCVGCRHYSGTIYIPSRKIENWSEFLFETRIISGRETSRTVNVKQKKLKD